MRKIFLTLFLLAVAVSRAWAVGTVTVTCAAIGNGNYTVTYAWTGDAANGSVPATAAACMSNNATTNMQGYRVFQVETVPGVGVPPTNNYTMTLTDAQAVDYLAGTTNALSSTVAAMWPVNAPAVSGNLTMTITGNVVNAATGTVIVYVGPQATARLFPTSLPISIGNTITGGTTGSVLFVGAGPVLQQDNANFFWSLGSHQLYLGHATGAALVDGLASSTEVGINLNGTQPASVGSGNGTNAQSIVTITGPQGGTTTDTAAAQRTGGNGGALSITLGSGGNSSSTLTSGGALNRAGNGGALSLTSGGGGNAVGSSGNTKGGIGGVYSLIAGAGGASTNGPGGAGGPFNFTSGQGGANTTGAAGGAGGDLTFTGGNGGNGSTVGGKGAAQAFLAGNGGSANGGSGGNGGNGGAITIDAGTGGALDGAGANGTAGAVNIGNTNASSIGIGRTGITTTLTGSWAQVGLTTTYNNIATVSGGHPAEYATIDLTAQSAAITATSLYTPAATGFFRVSYYAKVTTAASVSSILGGTTGLVLAYTDGTDSVAQTAFTLPEDNQAGSALSVGTGNTTNTTQAVLHGTAVIYAKTGVNMTYAFGYSSSGTAMQFELHVKVEAL